MADEQARRLIERIERTLGELKAHLLLADTAERPDPPRIAELRRWGGLLADVEAAGGVVTLDEWRDLGLRRGYDPRGLGGFYSGNEPTMTLLQDDRRALTERGREVAAQYRQRFGG